MTPVPQATANTDAGIRPTPPARRTSLLSRYWVLLPTIPVLAAVLLMMAYAEWLTPKAEALPTFADKLEDAPELKGGTDWLNTAGPIRIKDLGQDRRPRLLDALLHQLHPHPARPGEARKEVSQRARRHRRPLSQVRQRERDRKHPQGHPALRDQPSRRQRRRAQDLGRLRCQFLADAGADRSRRQARR